MSVKRSLVVELGTDDLGNDNAGELIKRKY